MKPHGYLINGNYYDENISTDELDLVLPLYAIETQPPQIKELSDEEIKVLKEIIRISDRKHPLWDKAKEFLK